MPPPASPAENVPPRWRTPSAAAMASRTSLPPISITYNASDGATAAVGEERRDLVGKVDVLVAGRVASARGADRVVGGDGAVRAVGRPHRSGKPEGARELLDPRGAVAEVVAAPHVGGIRDQQRTQVVIRRRVCAAAQRERVARIRQAGAEYHNPRIGRVLSRRHGRRRGGERCGEDRKYPELHHRSSLRRGVMPAAARWLRRCAGTTGTRRRGYREAGGAASRSSSHSDRSSEVAGGITNRRRTLQPPWPTAAGRSRSGR